MLAEPGVILDGGGAVACGVRLWKPSDETHVVLVMPASARFGA